MGCCGDSASCVISALLLLLFSILVLLLIIVCIAGPYVVCPVCGGFVVGYYSEQGFVLIAVFRFRIGSSSCLYIQQYHSS